MIYAEKSSEGGKEYYFFSCKTWQKKSVADIIPWKGPFVHQEDDGTESEYWVCLVSVPAFEQLRAKASERSAGVLSKTSVGFSLKDGSEFYVERRWFIGGDDGGSRSTGAADKLQKVISGLVLQGWDYGAAMIEAQRQYPELARRFMEFRKPYQARTRGSQFFGDAQEVS